MAKIKKMTKTPSAKVVGNLLQAAAGGAAGGLVIDQLTKLAAKQTSMKIDSKLIAASPILIGYLAILYGGDELAPAAYGMAGSAGYVEAREFGLFDDINGDINAIFD